MSKSIINKEKPWKANLVGSSILQIKLGQYNLVIVLDNLMELNIEVPVTVSDREGGRCQISFNDDSRGELALITRLIGVRIGEVVISKKDAVSISLLNGLSVTFEKHLRYEESFTIYFNNVTYVY